MPESKVRKKAAEKKKIERHEHEVEARQTTKKSVAPGSRRWVPPTFITVGLLGVAWLVVFYLAGRDVPFMDKLGNWNILIGMGLFAAAFGIATLWE